MDDKNIMKQSAEIGITAISSLVGFAIGGPVGAVVGGVTTPIVAMANQIVNDWRKKQNERITNIVTYAFQKTGRHEEELFDEIRKNDELADDIIKMIRQLVDTDPDLDYLFAEILASFFENNNQTEKNRMLVLYQAIKNLNRVQIRILKMLYCSNGTLSAKEIAENILIPEMELRNAVRDLELRGMIIDNGEEPTIWKMRELGKAIAELSKIMEETS